MEEIVAPFLPEYIPCYLICFIGAVGQILLLIAFIKDPQKCFRNSATYLIASLAVSDLIVTVYTPFRATPHYNPSDESTRQQIQWGFQIVAAVLNVSLLTVISITIDRFLLVVYPFKHRYIVSGKTVVVWIMVIWFLGFLPFIKQVIFGMAIYDSYVLIAFNLLTVILTVMFYLLTYCSLRRQARRLAQRNNTSIESRAATLRVVREKRFLNTIIIISAISVISITPLSIYAALVLFNVVHCQLICVECVLYTIYFINFAVNPFVYIWRLPQYRQTFNVLYCRCSR